MPTRDLKTAESLVSALKANDKTAVATFVKFPLSRKPPLPALESANEFVEHYDRVLFECSTKGHHLCIHQDGETVRYYSWKVGSALSMKPEIELTGEAKPDGSGGNTIYRFKNSGYVYEIDQTVICGEDCNSRLLIFRDAKKISDEVCR